MITVASACETLGIEYSEEYKYCSMSREILLDDAKVAYLKLIKLNHPDVGGDAEKARNLIESFKFLQKNLVRKKVTVTEWFENQEKKKKEKQKDKKSDKSKSTPKMIIQQSMTGETIKIWDSVSQAAKALNVHQAAISKVANKKPKFHSAGGFKWKFVIL